jgi:hypothetical protein
MSQTNQELRQENICAALALTPETYNGAWMRLFNDSGSIPDGPFNQRFLAYINLSLSTSYTALPGAMQAYAIAKGAPSWDGLGDFTP